MFFSRTIPLPTSLRLQPTRGQVYPLPFSFVLMVVPLSWLVKDRWFDTLANVCMASNDYCVFHMISFLFSFPVPFDLTAHCVAVAKAALVHNQAAGQLKRTNVVLIFFHVECSLELFRKTVDQFARRLLFHEAWTKASARCKDWSKSANVGDRSILALHSKNNASKPLNSSAVEIRVATSCLHELTQNVKRPIASRRSRGRPNSRIKRHCVVRVGFDQDQCKLEEMCPFMELPAHPSQASNQPNTFLVDCLRPW